MVSIISQLKRISHLDEWQSPSVVQKMNRMSLEYLILPESMKAIKNY